MLTSEEYRAVFEATPDGVLVVSRDGRIRDVNPQMETLFGYAREELLGEFVEILVPDTLRIAHEEHRRRYVKNPHTRPMGVGMELRGRRKDETEFPIEVSLSPWEEEQDGQLRMVCTVRDISDRKRLRDFSEGALRSVEEERQRIARELHDDTAQRLATLMLRVRLLCGIEKDDERLEAMEQLREEILEAAEGVKRIARGLRPPELEDVGVTSALRAHFRNLEEGMGLEVDADLDDVDHLLDDEGRLAVYRIVQESLSNVVRHSGVGRAEVRIETGDAMVVATIIDEGRGFKEIEAADQGAGLGLVGMQERAVMLGGRVLIDSTPGEGTTVRMELPAPVARKETQNV